VKTWLSEANWELELKEFTLGILYLESLFDIFKLQLYSLVDHFSLVGHGEVFHQVLRFPLR